MLSHVLWSRATNGLKHSSTVGIDIRSRSNPHPPLDHGPKVCDDISKHVIGYNHIEPFWILDHPHTDCINMGIISLDIRVLLAYLLKRPIP